SQPKTPTLHMPGARRQGISTAFATRPWLDKHKTESAAELFCYFTWYFATRERYHDIEICPGISA
ncbi:hypothetical protein, partial [Roseovarius sp. MMSF_3281]|uniref:hypothetical protein n=1 Tax=Roseovarius sp. MMSF_3281 TaxID=3046694 RepID=UPI00273CFEF1